MQFCCWLRQIRERERVVGESDSVDTDCGRGGHHSLGLSSLSALVHFLDKLLHESRFILLKADVEKTEEEAEQGAENANQDVEEGDLGATSEAQQRHHELEDALAKRKVHKVKPDAATVHVTLNEHQQHPEGEQIEGEQEASEGVEVVRREESDQGLQNNQHCHHELHCLCEHVDAVDARILNRFFKARFLFSGSRRRWLLLLHFYYFKLKFNL